MARIAVVGSVGLDEVVRLTAPLRPGTHMESCGRVWRIGGGAANVALPLAAAGHAVTVVSAVGRDEVGERLLAELAAAGVDCAAVTRVDGESTRSTVLVDPSGERTVVNLHRCSEEGCPARLEATPADLVYVRSRSRDLAPVLAVLRAPVVGHVPPTDPLSRPAGVLVASASDLALSDVETAWDLGRTVAGDRLRWVVVTRGAGGAVTLGEGLRLDTPAVPARSVDSTGAGDAFAAGLLHALAAGLDVPVAVGTAVRWGAAAVEHHGSALPPAVVRALL